MWISFNDFFLCQHVRVIRFQDTISAMIDAVEESLVDNFTLKCAQFPNLAITGQIKGSNKDMIFVQISDAKNSQYLQSKPNQSYSIHFHISQVNRVAFQQQHNALEWIAEHDLFDILINNPKYDLIPTHPIEDAEQNYVFR